MGDTVQDELLAVLGHPSISVLLDAASTADDTTFCRAYRVLRQRFLDKPRAITDESSAFIKIVAEKALDARCAVDTLDSELRGMQRTYMYYITPADDERQETLKRQIERTQLLLNRVAALGKGLECVNIFEDHVFQMTVHFKHSCLIVPCIGALLITHAVAGAWPTTRQDQTALVYQARSAACTVCKDLHMCGSTWRPMPAGDMLCDNFVGSAMAVMGGSKWRQLLKREEGVLSPHELLRAAVQSSLH